LTIVNDATTTVSLLLTRLGAITRVMTQLVALVALKQDKRYLNYQRKFEYAPGFDDR
jgi:hypothetical protein